MAGGSMHSIEEKFVERMVDEFNRKKADSGKTLRFSEDAMSKVRTAIENTVVSALRKVQRDGKKKLTKDQIEKAMKNMKPAF
jgi:histone H3/H4